MRGSKVKTEGVFARIVTLALLMTEHDRRINDKDIKAFENNEQKIHSYLPD